MKTLTIRTLLFFVIFTLSCSAQESWYETEYQYPVGGDHYMMGGLFVPGTSDNAYMLGEEYMYMRDLDEGTSEGFGQPVRAIGNGIVTKVTPETSGGYELHICHSLAGNKKVTSVYRSLSSVHCDPGDEVIRNDIIGLVGSGGNGEHASLLFEIRRGGKTVTGKSFFARHPFNRSGRLSPSVFIDDMGREKVFDLLAINSRTVPLENEFYFDQVTRQNTLYVEYGGKKYNLSQARVNRIISGAMYRHDAVNEVFIRVRPTELLYPNTRYVLDVFKNTATLHAPVTQGNGLAFSERAKTDILHYLAKKGCFFFDAAAETTYDNEDSVGYRFWYYRTRKEYGARKHYIIEHEQYKAGPMRTILPEGDHSKAVTVRPHFTQ